QMPQKGTLIFSDFFILYGWINGKIEAVFPVEKFSTRCGKRFFPIRRKKQKIGLIWDFFGKIGGKVC
ncbi:MAG: hypothetical protein KBS76_00930, partial [Ruminococcus sp.]|nr:hypothetical protein [Candidatus Apopatosoma intestinale]